MPRQIQHTVAVLFSWQQNSTMNTPGFRANLGICVAGWTSSLAMYVHRCVYHPCYQAVIRNGGP